MAEVERIWRIMTDDHKTIEIRLFTGADGEPVVALDQTPGAGAGGVYAVDTARAIAQVMLEACEVASVLGEQFAVSR
jgi:ATP-dependent protease HslVU (ClpYQ) peptidase subunit